MIKSSNKLTFHLPINLKVNTTNKFDKIHRPTDLTEQYWSKYIG